MKNKEKERLDFLGKMVLTFLSCMLGFMFMGTIVGWIGVFSIILACVSLIGVIVTTICYVGIKANLE